MERHDTKQNARPVAGRRAPRRLSSLPNTLPNVNLRDIAGAGRPTGVQTVFFPAAIPGIDRDLISTKSMGFSGQYHTVGSATFSTSG